jgi:hypothetical protein
MIGGNFRTAALVANKKIDHRTRLLIVIKDHNVQIHMILCFFRKKNNFFGQEGKYVLHTTLVIYNARG